MSLLQMSISGAIMVLAVIVIRALGINRLPKKTFLALWGIVLLRLLIPFSFPSPFSAYSLVSNHISILQGTAGAGGANIFPASPIVFPTTGGDAQWQPVAHISPYSIVWGIGFVLCALFFAISYFKCHREFRESLPIKNDFPENWLAEHGTIRPTQIRQSSRISAPLTYGIFKPIILMPKKTNWNDTEQIEYILAHELIHIKRFDVATKLLLTATLCIHWFNPLVWAMYILFNRDIELSCDETVVRSFGNTTKSAYARALISMEEKKNRLTPLCNNFSKNAIEERITAIMKMKKISAFSVVTALAIILSITTVFATSPTVLAATPDPTNKDNVVGNSKDTVSHDGEYAKWGIQIKDGVYYYNNDRVRIFMDMRAEGSFEKSFVDDNGKVDVRLIRNVSGTITQFELIEEKEAQEILDDLNGFPSVTPTTETPPAKSDNLQSENISHITRLTKDDISSELQTMINSCNDTDWYVFEDSSLQYIFYNGLSKDYAFQLDGSALKIVDIGKSKDVYVLLAIPKVSNLAITYHSETVVITKIEIK